MATVPSTQKILTSNEAVNTTYGGSQALKELNTWYTMEDISNTVKPYKVFTALLTQSGGDDPSSLSGNPLVIGTTYTIDGYVDGDDFTNVGAPYNADGVSFIATGTIANSFEFGAELLYNIGAPVVTVLENTIGNVWFTYDSVGVYNINSSGLLLIDKRQFYYGLLKSLDNANGSIIESDSVAYNNNFIQIITLDNSGNGANGMYNTPIEIRVYN